MAVAEFRAALRRFLRLSETVARQSGLTPQRYLLLLMIKGAPRGDEQLTIMELAECLQIGQPAVTELVKRAERAGLLVREQWPQDARATHLRLSPEGERRLALTFSRLGTDLAPLRETLRDVADARTPAHLRGRSLSGAGSRRPR